MLLKYLCVTIICVFSDKYMQIRKKVSFSVTMKNSDNCNGNCKWLFYCSFEFKWMLRVKCNVNFISTTSNKQLLTVTTLHVWLWWPRNLATASLPLLLAGSVLGIYTANSTTSWNPIRREESLKLKVTIFYIYVPQAEAKIREIWALLRKVHHFMH